MLWIFQFLQTVGYYGFGTLAPLVLAAKGFDVVESLGYTAVIFLGYPAGSALSVPLMERFERKHLIIGSALTMAALGLVFGFARTPWLILAAGFLITSASNVFSNGFHVYQAEIFPTRMRATAVGTAYSLSRLSGAILPFITVAVLDGLGATAVFVGCAAILVVAEPRRRAARPALHRAQPRGVLRRRRAPPRADGSQRDPDAHARAHGGATRLLRRRRWRSRATWWRFPRSGCGSSSARRRSRPAGSTLQVDVIGRPKGFIRAAHVHRGQTETPRGDLRRDGGRLPRRRKRVLRAGDTIEVPPDTPHTQRPVGDGPGHIRVTIRPARNLEALPGAAGRALARRPVQPLRLPAAAGRGPDGARAGRRGPRRPAAAARPAGDRPRAARAHPHASTTSSTSGTSPRRPRPCSTRSPTPTATRVVEAASTSTSRPPDGPPAVGHVARQHFKGRLPYHLHTRTRTVRLERPHVIEGETDGDLRGRGSLDADGRGRRHPRALRLARAAPTARCCARSRRCCARRCAGTTTGRSPAPGRGWSHTRSSAPSRPRGRRLRLARQAGADCRRSSPCAGGSWRWPATSAARSAARAAATPTARSASWPTWWSPGRGRSGRSCA